MLRVLGWRRGGTNDCLPLRLSSFRTGQQLGRTQAEDLRDGNDKTQSRALSPAFHATDVRRVVSQSFGEVPLGPALSRPEFGNNRAERLLGCFALPFELGTDGPSHAEIIGH